MVSRPVPRDAPSTRPSRQAFETALLEAGPRATALSRKPFVRSFGGPPFETGPKTRRRPVSHKGSAGPLGPHGYSGRLRRAIGRRVLETAPQLPLWTRPLYAVPRDEPSRKAGETGPRERPVRRALETGSHEAVFEGRSFSQADRGALENGPSERPLSPAPRGPSAAPLYTPPRRTLEPLQGRPLVRSRLETGPKHGWIRRTVPRDGSWTASHPQGGPLETGPRNGPSGDGPL